MRLTVTANRVMMAEMVFMVKEEGGRRQKALGGGKKAVVRVCSGKKMLKFAEG
jgi:hypothetical protein